MTLYPINIRSLILLAIGMIHFTGCTKQNGTTTVPGTGTVDTTTATLKYSGNFINGPYGSVSGSAKVYFENNTYLLKLQEMNISNGPDLHVYISRERFPVNFINLGRLQSTRGNQVYSVPGNPNFLQYPYILIHCKQFNHLFGSAELR